MSKNPTAAQLLQAARDAGATGTDESIKKKINEAKAKSFKRVKELFAKASAPRRIRSERVIEAGPRGFRFGKVWNDSVKAGSGIAVHPTYLAKLKAHAKAVGVSSAGSDAAAIAAEVAKHL
jgi:hypothetical protein